MAHIALVVYVVCPSTFSSLLRNAYYIGFD